MTKILAVGFDWGGVLNGQPGYVFGQQIEKLLQISTERYQSAYFSHNKKANRGEITWDELWRLVLSDLGMLSKLPEVLVLNAKSQEKSPNHEVLTLVDTLRMNGYKTGLLSNNSIERAEILRSEGLDKHFDAFHISAETGYVKPEPKAFLHLADELDVLPHQLVFIDDTPRSLSTAKEIGYKPLLFTKYSVLLEDLSKLGVVI